MAKSIKLRQGTEAEHAAFTGAMAEVTFDTTNNRIILHDGTTPGGIPMAKLSDVPVDLTDLTDVDDNLPSGTGGAAAFSGTTYIVTVSSGTNTYGTSNKYYITDEIGASPTVTLTEGETYRFDQSDSTNAGHPLKFSTTANGTHDSGSEYTTGVTYNGVPGQTGAYTEITVEVGAPTLYYYCPNHNGMGSVGAAPVENSLVLNSSNTTLLVTATGTSDNNNITDSSTNNHSITVNGDVMAGTFSPFRPGGYSMYFDGSGGDWVKSETHADFGFGTDDFTIECWYYPVSRLNPYSRIWNFGPFWQNSQSLAFIDRHDDTNTVLTVNSWTTGEILRSTTTIENGKWYHLTVERSGTTITLYVNGVSEDTYDAGTSEFITSSPSYVTIGNVSDGSNLTESALHGNIRDFRYVKGTAVYGANFTLPTGPLTEVTNTKLLTAQGLQFSDVSANNHSMSKTGDVSTMPLAPYDYSEYNPSIHGGSVYFDGSGDYLTVNDTNIANFGTNDFTIETWIYCNDTIFHQLVDTRPTNTNGAYVTLGIQAGSGVQIYSNSTDIMGGLVGTINVGQWHHVAWVRNSGTINIYIDGTSVGSVSNSTNFISSNFAIGWNAFLGEYTGSFKISDFNITKDFARYTANFTPPTAPLSSSGSSLHLKGTDASIIDKSQSNNDLTLFGNTTGSTTQVKFADTKSMYFDGSGDYIKTSASTDYDLPADFTIEAWIYPTALSSHRLIVDTYSTSQAGSYQLYWRETGNSLAFYSPGDGVLLQDPSSSSILVNTWNHVAVSRSGTSAKLFVNGTVVDTATNSRDFTHGIPVAIGYQQATSNNYFAGYMQDVRITKGLARYTANFTPPTKSLGSNVVPAAPAAGPAPMWSLSGDSATFAAATTAKLDTNATGYLALHHPTGWGNSWGLEDGSYAMRNNPNALNEPAPGKSVHIWSTDDLSEGMTYQYYIKFGTVQPTMWENLSVISADSSALYSYTQWLTADSNYPHTLGWGSNGVFGYYSHSANGSTRLDSQGWLHVAIELQSNGRIVHYVNGVVVLNEDASDVSSLTSKANVFFGTVNSWMTDIEVYTGGGIHNPDLLATPPGFTPPARKQA